LRRKKKAAEKIESVKVEKAVTAKLSQNPQFAILNLDSH